MEIMESFVYRFRLDATDPHDQYFIRLLSQHDQYVHEGFDHDNKLNVFATTDSRSYNYIYDKYMIEGTQLTWSNSDVYELCYKCVKFAQGLDPSDNSKIAHETSEFIAQTMKQTMDKKIKHYVTSEKNEY
jgi:hypothetical protein